MTKKEQLNAKLIEFQKKLITLSREGKLRDKQAQDREEAIFLEVATVLDAFENVFNTLQNKEDLLDKSSKRALKSFRAIYRKLLRVLKESGVEKLEFPDGKAEIGLCKVIDTEVLEGCEEGAIISVIRNGYRRGSRILRPAEVITASEDM